LDEARLPGADLIGADLIGARLNGVDLNGADLSGADLSYAQGMSNEELEKQQVSSFEGATMPNGQKYEDWLKSREADGG
jgi:uncharacterized protein YjbI with pentapeptide repeats